MVLFDALFGLWSLALTLPLQSAEHGDSVSVEELAHKLQSDLLTGIAPRNDVLTRSLVHPPTFFFVYLFKDVLVTTTGARSPGGNRRRATGDSSVMSSARPVSAGGNRTSVTPKCDLGGKNKVTW